MCDRREIVFAGGLASESFLFGEYLSHETSALRAEIIALFPEFGQHGPEMTLARLSLKGHERQLIDTAAAFFRLIADQSVNRRGAILASGVGALRYIRMRAVPDVGQFWAMRW